MNFKQKLGIAVFVITSSLALAFMWVATNESAEAATLTSITFQASSQPATSSNASSLYFDGTQLKFSTGGTFTAISTSTGGQWTTSGSDIYYNTGNVGVGDSTPTAKLDVGGDVGISGGSTRATQYAGTTFGLVGGYTSPISGRIMFGDGSGWKLNFSRGTPASPTDLVTIMDTGRVGIGTSTPATLLHVAGTSQFDLDMRIGNAWVFLGTGMAVRDNGAGGVAFYNTAGSAITNYLSLIGGNSYFANGGGNIGVSTTTPTTARLVISPGSQPSIDAGGQRIINVAIPTGINDVATKTYVDSALGGGTTYLSDITGKVARNLLDTNTWTVSNGTIGNWTSNSTGVAESQRVWDVDPFGRPALVWKDVTDAGNDAAGGWGYTNIPIDNNKAYRLTVWFKPGAGAVGSLYLGCDGGNTLNLSNVADTNPYFLAHPATSLTAGRWYLFVGYIHAQNDASTTHYSGIYDGVTGQKVVNGNDFKNRGLTSNQIHRSFSYYNTAAGTTNVQWGPRFEQLDGSEPTIEALLGNFQAATNATNAYFGGNVGVGTSAPATLLDVNGTATITQVNYRAGGSIAGTVNGPVIYSQDGTLAGRFYNGALHLNGALNVKNDADTVVNMVVQDTGNVGIGSGTPGKKLDVQGGAMFGVGAFSSGAVVDIGSVATDYQANAGWAASWNSNLLLSGLDYTSITFHDSGMSVGALGYHANQFFLDGAGSWGPVKLGINTRTPATTLDVNGPIAQYGVSTIQATQASSSLAIGPYAGGLTGVNNTSLGFFAMNSNTTGYNNSALGYQALYSNVSGYRNAALGYQALRSNYNGNSNSALGIQALYSNTSGFQNTAVGEVALYNNTTGGQNAAVGSGALLGNTTGYENSAVGMYALMSNTTGGRNSAFGSSALYLNTTGIYNSALGYQALYSNATSSSNTAVGTLALYSSKGAGNTAIGASSLTAVSSGNNNTALGASSLGQTTGSNNIGIGYYAASNLVAGSYNTFIGGFNATGFASVNNNTFISDGQGNLRLRIDNAGNIYYGTAGTTLGTAVYSCPKIADGCAGISTCLGQLVSGSGQTCSYSDSNCTAYTPACNIFAGRLTP